MSKINTNLVIITGNLTRDAEVRFTASKTPVSTFTVACNRQGQNNEQAVDYFTCVLWGRTAEALEPYLKKGKNVLVKGRLQTRSYEGKDGTKKTVTEIVADNFNGVELLGGGERRENQNAEDMKRLRNGSVTIPRGSYRTEMKQNVKPNDWNPLNSDDEFSDSGKSDIPF